MIRDTLVQLGLSPAEVQIYLTLLSIKQAPVSTIAKKCGLKRPSTYVILEKMLKSGYVSSFSKNKIKYFSAVDPEVLLDKNKYQLIEFRQTIRNLEKILPLLKGLQGEQLNVKVQFFEGLEGIKSMYEDVILENKIMYGVLAGYTACPPVRKYLEESYIPQRSEQVDKRSKIIIISNSKAQDYLKKYNHDVAIISPEELDLNVTVHIYGHKIGFYAIQDEKSLYGILIESQAISETIQSIFLALWNRLKKN